MTSNDTIVARLDTLISQVSKLRQEVGQIQGSQASMKEAIPTLAKRVDGLEEWKNKSIGIMLGVQSVVMLVFGVFIKLIDKLGW